VIFSKLTQKMRCVRESNADLDSPCARCVKVGRQCIPPTASQAPFEDRRYRRSRADQRRHSQDVISPVNHQAEVTPAPTPPTIPLLPSIYSTSPYANHMHYSGGVQVSNRGSTLDPVTWSSRSDGLSDGDAAQFVEMYVTPNHEMIACVNCFLDFENDF
jgi:hypothetical protein